jgi:hypothetical protein
MDHAPRGDSVQWDISKWDVSSVGSMKYVLAETAFNGDISKNGMSLPLKSMQGMSQATDVQWRYFRMGCLFRHKHVPCSRS